MMHGRKNIKPTMSCSASRKKKLYVSQISSITKTCSVVVKILRTIHYVALGIVVSPEEGSCLLPKGSVLC